MRFAVLLLLAALLAPAHLSAQTRLLDSLPVVDPLKLPSQSPAGDAAPASADVDPARRWSAPRLAVGAAVAAAGVWYALSERGCRLDGDGTLGGYSPFLSGPGTVAVAQPSHAPAALATLHIAYGSPENPVTAWTGSGCSLDFDYTSQEFWSTEVGTRTLVATYADVDPDAVRRRSTTESAAQGDHPPAPPEALMAMQGGVVTEDYFPRLYPGIGIAAAGAVVALFFSRVGVPDTVAVNVAPERASLSLRLSF